MDGDEDDWDFDLLDQLEQNHQAKANKDPSSAAGGPSHHPQHGAAARSHSRAVLSNTTNVVRDGRPTTQQATVKQLWHRSPGQSQPGVSYQVGNSSFLAGSSHGWDDTPDNKSWEALTNGYMASAGSFEPRHHYQQRWAPPQGADLREEECIHDTEMEDYEYDGISTEPPLLMTCTTTTAGGGIKVDPSKARHWVYPSHVPRREYQVAMVQTALFHNTLCCLPTGLGKTMIAAVVMYNFYRWFPEGKIVFVAPTKPLVNQQISACAEKTGLPDLVTQELTGSIKADERARLWEEKRVFYCTPATLNNDVCKGICPMKKVVCLVIDECHRATGQHPIVQAVKQLREADVKFRMLGLSATPGSRFQAVQDVLANLMISKIEFRSEEDPDVASYTFKKQVEVKVVSSGPNSELAYCRSVLVETLRSILRRLISLKAYFNSSLETATRYSLVQAQQRLKEDPSRITGSRNEVFLFFTQAIFLASNFEQLDKYGLAQAHEHADREMAKPAMQKLLGCHPGFKEYQQRLGSLVSQGSQHPKMKMLEDVVCGHFQSTTGKGPAAAVPGRVIVFTNLRESVQGIVTALSQHGGLISAKAFVGQGGGGTGGAGMKQSEQKKVLQMFRDGGFNTLVATCIGEEGLDIPAVDLIICFDGAASPTRNIQRMGRTGRHKEGRVVYILAEGKEEQDYTRNQETTRALHKQLRTGGNQFDMYNRSPRMVPRMFNPDMLMVDLKPDLKPSGDDSAADSKGRRGRGRGRGSRGRGRGLTTGRARGRSRGRVGGRAGAAAANGEDGDPSGGSSIDCDVPLRIRVKATAAITKPRVRPRARQAVQAEVIDSSPEAERPPGSHHKLRAERVSPAPDYIPPSDSDDDGSPCLTIRQRTNLLSQRPPPSPPRPHAHGRKSLSPVRPEDEAAPITAATRRRDFQAAGVGGRQDSSPGRLRADDPWSPKSNPLSPLDANGDCVLVSPTLVEEALLQLDEPATEAVASTELASPGSDIRRMLFGAHLASHTNSNGTSRPALVSDPLARSLPQLVEGAEFLQTAACLAGGRGSHLAPVSAPRPVPGQGLLRRLGALYSASGAWALGCASIQPAPAPVDVASGSPGAVQEDRPSCTTASLEAFPQADITPAIITSWPPLGGAPAEASAAPKPGEDQSVDLTDCVSNPASPPTKARHTKGCSPLTIPDKRLCSNETAAVAEGPGSDCTARVAQPQKRDSPVQRFRTPPPPPSLGKSVAASGGDGDGSGSGEPAAGHSDFLLTQDTVPLALRIPGHRRKPIGHAGGMDTLPRPDRHLDTGSGAKAIPLPTEHRDLPLSQTLLAARGLKRQQHPASSAPEITRQCTENRPGAISVSPLEQRERTVSSSPEADLLLRSRIRDAEGGAVSLHTGNTLPGGAMEGVPPARQTHRLPRRSPSCSPEADVPLSSRRRQAEQPGMGRSAIPNKHHSGSAPEDGTWFGKPSQLPAPCSSSRRPEMGNALTHRRSAQQALSPESSPEAAVPLSHRRANVGRPHLPKSTPSALLRSSQRPGEAHRPAGSQTLVRTPQASLGPDEMDLVPLASRLPPPLLDTPLSAQWVRPRARAVTTPTLLDSAVTAAPTVPASPLETPTGQRTGEWTGTTADDVDTAVLASRVPSALDVPLSARRGWRHRMRESAEAHASVLSPVSASQRPLGSLPPGDAHPPEQVEAEEDPHAVGSSECLKSRPGPQRCAPSALTPEQRAGIPLGSGPVARNSTLDTPEASRAVPTLDGRQEVTPTSTAARRAADSEHPSWPFPRSPLRSARVSPGDQQVPSLAARSGSNPEWPAAEAVAQSPARSPCCAAPPAVSSHQLSRPGDGGVTWATASIDSIDEDMEAVEDSQEQDRCHCPGATEARPTASGGGRFQGDDMPLDQQPECCTRSPDDVAAPTLAGKSGTDPLAAAVDAAPGVCSVVLTVQSRFDVTCESEEGHTAEDAAALAEADEAHKPEQDSLLLPTLAEGAAPSQGWSSGLSREPPDLSLSQEGLWDFGQDYDDGEDDSDVDDLLGGSPLLNSAGRHLGVSVIGVGASQQHAVTPSFPEETGAARPRGAPGSLDREGTKEMADTLSTPGGEPGVHTAREFPVPPSPRTASASKMVARSPRVEYDTDSFARPTPRRMETAAGPAASTPGYNQPGTPLSSSLTDDTPGMTARRVNRRAVLLDSSPEDGVAQEFLPPSSRNTPLYRRVVGQTDDELSRQGRPKVLFDSPKSAAHHPAHRRRRVISGLEDSPMKAPPVDGLSRPPQRGSFGAGKPEEASPARPGQGLRRAIADDDGVIGAAQKRRRLAEGAAAKLSRRRAAKMFFDEEAEDSDDEGAGGSEDPDDGRDLEGFIVATQDVTESEASGGPHATPTASAEGGDINMYRRMLLQSASPASRGGGWHHRMMRYLDKGPGSVPAITATPTTGGQSTGSSAGASHHDTCDQCGLDGELLLCDTCPRAFHLRCVGILEVPDGEWSCEHCKTPEGPAPMGGRAETSTQAATRGVLFSGQSEGGSDGDEEDDEDEELPNFDL